MKKEINLVIGGSSFAAFESEFICVHGGSIALERLAFAVCPTFHPSFIRGIIRGLWFYRGVLVFEDSDIELRFVVPTFGCRRFSSLRGAKCAISRFAKDRKEVLK